MWANSNFSFVSRVVFLGETQGADSAIRSDDQDLRRLLLHRLEVLEAALLRISQLRGEAPWHQGCNVRLNDTH